ncbi:hypothetical protein O181_097313 [Austropuccinia psidii MF-1]|uniref:Uncharacterized protein n=1 Tax=Austropuccinia psidii MF-1 TaxID=1389203 RepID=A0A9Q3PD27_9BASI|nr:hypothetical protein [Austropuccinia psidii MF-1]
MAMARGHSNLRQSSPCLVTDGIQRPKTKPPNPPRKDSSIPSLPRKQTPGQPTPGLKPSQTKEPPIPGPSPCSQPPEDNTTREPEPECPREPQCLLPPVQSPSHSHDDARHEFTDLRPTLMIPQAIVHKSINRILLEHCRLVHMIPFVDGTHRNEMHQEFQEELNSLLAQALEAYPKENITGVIFKFLEK